MKIEEISHIIKSNPLDPKGYIMLGDHLLVKNPQQAFLCYENALFYSQEADEKSNLIDRIDFMRQMKKDVPKAAIIILSYNLKDDVRINIESIRKTTPESAREIIVVDNASEDDSVEYLKAQSDVILKANKNNEGFPKGCNQGIELAQKESDIFLLNNDTIMMPNTLFWLRMGLYESDEYGSAGCVTNNINGLQTVVEKNLPIETYYKYALENNVYSDNCIEFKPFIVGFAMLIKRTVLDKVGMLDEAYSPGNYEDDDYGLRIIKAGYSNVVVHNSFLVHSGSKSFGKRKDYVNILSNNKSMFENKHGVFDSDFVMMPNPILLDIFKNNIDITGNKSLLEINHTFGAFLYREKYLNPSLVAEGISNRELAKNCAIKSDLVSLRNVEQASDFNDMLGDGVYDSIVVNCYQDDNVDIDTYVNIVYKHLKTNGKAVFVIENSRYFGNWLPLLLGKKPSRTNCVNSITNERFVNAINGKLVTTKWIFEYKNPEDEVEKNLLHEIEDSVCKLGYKRDEINHIRYYVIVEHA